MTAAVRLPLVECEPYSMRLLESSCARQWREAQKRGHSLHVSACRRCDVGWERAGKPRRQEPHRYVRVEGSPMRGTSRRGMVLARCTCGREPPRWVESRSVRYERGCNHCRLDALKLATQQHKGRYTHEELVELDQARRSERTKGGKR